MPFLTPLIAWLAKSALMTSPFGTFLKKIPWQVWAVIATIILLYVGVKWHDHEVKKTYQAGYDQALADVKAEAAKVIAPLKEAKTTGDATVAAVNEGVKKNHDTQSAHIDSNVADLLSMYQTGGRSSSVAERGVHDASGSAGGQPAAAPANDGLAQAAGDRPTITVDAQQLITRAGICDRDYIALTAWEDAYAGWRQAYDDWAAKVKVAQPSH
jgi:hypothetical protein